MRTNRTSPRDEHGTPWPMLVYVVGLLLLFLGFTDFARVTDASIPLFYAFLTLLSLAVFVGMHRGKSF